jgi:hypothetical protein
MLFKIIIISLLTFRHRAVILRIHRNIQIAIAIHPHFLNHSFCFFDPFRVLCPVIREPIPSIRGVKGKTSIVNWCLAQLRVVLLKLLSGHVQADFEVLRLWEVLSHRSIVLENLEKILKAMDHAPDITVGSTVSLLALPNDSVTFKHPDSVYVMA